VSDLDAHLTAIAAGDADAFESWLAKAEPTIRSGLRSFAAIVDTEAVLQESLLRVWQVAPRVVPDGRPNALLRMSVRIARNLAISSARKAAREVPKDDGFEDRLERLGENVSAPDPFLRGAIEECREKLPEKPRQALDARLYSMGAEPDAELAARLSMRHNTFLVNVTRARKLLAECLKQRGVDLQVELA
jgi:RNA polymerase sigma-70 factor (ECF subfamily)